MRPNHAIITGNAPLKITSLIVAFAFWNVLTQKIDVQRTIDVPICLYNSNDVQFDTPNSVRLTLRGNQSIMRNLDQETIALHINAHKLSSDINWIAVTDADLFVPEGVSMIHCNPPILTITTCKQICKTSSSDTDEDI